MTTRPPHPNRKLSPQQAAIIRQRRALGEKLYSIAVDFGVRITTVSRICRGEIYRTLS